MAVFLQALGIKNSSGLEADLKAVTEVNLLDSPPKEVLLSLTQASHTVGDRQEIMRHLQGCLTPSSNWRRIYGGQILLEELLQNGAPALVAEISQGLHFDPVQRLTFLERFEYSQDRRVQHMLRQKATSLRALLIDKLKNAESLEDFGGSAPSVPVKQKPSVNGFAGVAGTDLRPERKTGVVNGIVSVGHREDTDSESEQDAKGRRAPKEGKSAATPPQNLLLMEDNSDKEGQSNTTRGHGPSTPPTIANGVQAKEKVVDLLDF